MVNTEIKEIVDMAIIIDNLNSNNIRDISESAIEDAIGLLKERNKGKTYKEYRLLVPSGEENAACRIAESLRDRGHPIIKVEKNANPSSSEWYLNMTISQ
jgi:hypothetical protein